MDSRTDLIILGRKIGTYTGWDDMETASFMFYGFVPDAPDVTNLPAGDLYVMYDEGVFQYFDNDGNVTKAVDILETLRDIPRFSDIVEV